MQCLPVLAHMRLRPDRDAERGGLRWVAGAGAITNGFFKGAAHHAEMRLPVAGSTRERPRKRRTVNAFRGSGNEEWEVCEEWDVCEK
jgi:hypothetical protein